MFCFCKPVRDISEQVFYADQGYFCDGSHRNAVPDVFSEGWNPERHSEIFFSWDRYNPCLQPNFGSLYAVRNFFIEKYYQRMVPCRFCYGVPHNPLKSLVTVFLQALGKQIQDYRSVCCSSSNQEPVAGLIVYSFCKNTVMEYSQYKNEGMK